jgi:putative polyketide hydroxylase
MTHDKESTTPVLIAGAGPAGLTAAIALARQGIEVLVVERKTELSSLPRATVISTRSMKVLRSWGLQDALRAGGVEVEWKMLACESLALAAAGSAIPVGLPSREQSALISPSMAECVPQDHTERVLFDHLVSLGRARVELGTEVVGLEHGPDGARVALRPAGGRASRSVRAPSSSAMPRTAPRRAAAPE